MTDNSDIIAEREYLTDKVVDAQIALAAAQGELRHLQARCKHPNRVMTTHMGEMCNHCYDCGLCP